MHVHARRRLVVSFALACVAAGACHSGRRAPAPRGSAAVVVRVSLVYPRPVDVAAFLRLIGPHPQTNAAICVTTRDSLVVLNELVPGEYRLQVRAFLFHSLDSTLYVRDNSVDTVLVAPKPNMCDLDCGEVVIPKRPLPQPRCRRTMHG